MIRKKITIVNKLGLHARAAAKLVALTSQFEADIELLRDERRVNGKSIMGVMMLAASKNTEVEVIINGSDENQACLAVEVLFNNRFGESE